MCDEPLVMTIAPRRVRIIGRPCSPRAGPSSFALGAMMLPHCGTVAQGQQPLPGALGLGGDACRGGMGAVKRHTILRWAPIIH